MHGKRKWAAELLFLILVIGATGYALLRDGDLETLLTLLRSAQRGYWLDGLGLVVLFICGESLVLRTFFRGLGTRYQLSHCFLYSFVGFFFSCITPSAGGGQPAQVVFMKKDGIPAGISVPVLMLVTITYKLVLVLFGVGVFLFRPERIWAALHPVRAWCGLGFALNVLFVGLYLVLLYQPRLLQGMLQVCLRFLPQGLGQKLRGKLDQWMDSYRDAAQSLGKNWSLLLRIMVLTILQRCLLFAVTWLTMRSFGIVGDLAEVVVLQAMISMGTDLLPLPGGMGASEAMFLRIFPGLCEGMTLPVLLVSRGLSYYGQLLISAVFTLVAVFRLGRFGGEEDAV